MTAQPEEANEGPHNSLSGQDRRTQLPHRKTGWTVPTPYGAPAATESLSTIAAPLLGGFSVAVASLVISASDKFRLFSISLLLLAVAFVLLVLCVQCGFWSRYYFVKPDEDVAWWPDYDSNVDRQAMVHSEQQEWYVLYRIWAARSRKTYSLGIVAFLLGLSMALVPSGTGWQAVVQWITVGIVGLAAIGEAIWVFASSKKSTYVPRRLRQWIVPTQKGPGQA